MGLRELEAGQEGPHLQDELSSWDSIPHTKYVCVLGVG